MSTPASGPAPLDVSVRPMKAADFAAARRVFRLAFGTVLNVPDPESFGLDREYISTRWQTDPRAAFVAEIEDSTMPLTLNISAFADGELIPRRHTCEGDDLSPALEWSGAPPNTESFALIVDDPDAPAGTWNHWLLWDLAAHQHSLPEGFEPGELGSSGKNDFGRPGYGGPCPPRGHGAHRYYFTLYALDRAALGLAPAARRADLDRALKGRVLEKAQYMGRYERR